MKPLPITLESLCNPRELTQDQVSRMLDEVKSELDNLLTRLNDILAGPVTE